MHTTPTALPDNPLAAITHDAPQDYYASLAQRGLYFEPVLNSWVAAEANSIQAVLSHPALKVRPHSEPVPPALHHTPAATIFAALVRMNDGQQHAAVKSAIQQALNTVSAADITQNTTFLATSLTQPRPLTGPALTRFNYTLASTLLAHYFGLPASQHELFSQQVLALLPCIAPGGSAEDIRAGIQAAGKLQQTIYSLLACSGPLLQQLAIAIEQTKLPDQLNLLIANAIGLLFQACEATAGLIGQALLHAQRTPGPHSGKTLVSTILREAPPIQNTRRFAAQDAQLSACPIRAGETVLLVLAAKCEQNTQNFAFGYGVHTCPGESWARAMASAGIDYLLQLDLTMALAKPTWRRSLNARVPEFL
ncbi:hypothetical protein HZU77_008545 [Neisseriaceae bacterium TC5R-5]|nr:hypothetical protein [Neisseriaceae bacterium TC5R-5]